MSLSNGLTVLGNVSIMHIVNCAQDTQFTAWLSINQMSMEYADMNITTFTGIHATLF